MKPEVLKIIQTLTFAATMQANNEINTEGVRSPSAIS